MARAVHAVGAGAAVLVLSACTATSPVDSTPSSGPSPTPTPTGSTVVLGQPGCTPASPVGTDVDSGFSEVQGTVSGGHTLYGLVMGAYPFRVSGDVIKVVWRLTGEGSELTATLTDPAGTPRPLAWGPEYHGGSTYDRPGGEWGTGITFDQPGCWTLDLSRSTDGAASVYFDVAP